MAAKKKESYFWTSYSDLMTSLFFVMLVLFALALAKVVDEKNASESQLQKIKEIEESIKRIDSTYFSYNDKYKKHILNIQVQFKKGSADLNDIPDAQRSQLIEAGRAVAGFLKDSTANKNAQYLLVIEGQASKDNASYNDELSYERANALRKLWSQNNISFGNSCETLVSGSGTGGVLRDSVEQRNQRFLIHIIPKPGTLNDIKPK